MPSRLRNEIKQKRPFSPQEEVVLGLLRTADQLALSMTEVLKEAELSFSQYNVLRILRGAEEAAGLSCGEITERMVRRDPDLTRLLDRLEARGLVERARSESDRRVVLARITREGSKLLDALDAPVRTTVKRALAHMPEERLSLLGELLDEARAGS